MKSPTALARTQDLIDNPLPRCACVLVLDTSSSMDGGPIEALNAGVSQFIREVQTDEIASQCLELGVVTFGGQAVVQMPLTPVQHLLAMQPLIASGNTPMGQGAMLALAMLEARKREYKRHGVSYYQPWMVLMSDGEPTDAWQGPAQGAHSLSSAGKLVVLPVGVGKSANLGALGQFSSRPAVALQGLKFREFFRWLSASMSRVSVSTPGNGVQLPSKGGWESI